MKEDLIADLWSIVVGHIPENKKSDVAADFINILMDHGIKESVLDSLQGVDPYLDDAIQYAIDGEEIDDEYYDDEE